MAASKKYVLITGCSAGGIGDALAQVFQENRYHVFATLRNSTKISPTLSSAPNVTVLTLDVLSSESIAAAVDSVAKETGGRLDVLINNSGGGYSAPGLDASIDEGKKLFELNFWAPYAMFQAFAPFLIASKGCLVNNSSANAYLPMPLQTMYSASKAAMAIASETWRHELAPLGVRTITIYTCAVKTNFWADPNVAAVPETSRYYPVRDFIRDISDGRLQKDGIPAQQYAQTVFRKIDGGATGPLWAGAIASFARMGVFLTPQWAFDMLVQSIIPLPSEMTKAAKKANNPNK